MQLPTQEELQKAWEAIKARGPHDPNVKDLHEAIRNFEPIERIAYHVTVATEIGMSKLGGVIFAMVACLTIGLEIADQRVAAAVKKVEEDEGN